MCNVVLHAYAFRPHYFALLAVGSTRILNQNLTTRRNGVSDREEFETWWNGTHPYPVAGSSPYEVQGAWDAWKALKDQVSTYRNLAGSWQDRYNSLSGKIDALEAKQERLEKELALNNAMKETK